MTLERFERTLQDIIKAENLYISGYLDDNYEILQKLFVRLFNKAPYIYKIKDSINWSTDFENNSKEIAKYRNIKKDNNIKMLPSSIIISEEYEDDKKRIDMTMTMNKIIETYNDEIVVYRISNFCWIIGPYYIIEQGTIFCSIPYEQKFEKCIIYEESKNPTMEWVSYDSRGNFNTFSMDVISKGDIEGNYNDDLPDEKINAVLEEDSSSIMILHGPCGTGKTNYIRNLIGKHKDKSFYWLDSSMFAQINSSEFINFLLECKNGIFILEDCEVLLTDRDRSGNGLLSSLLNISDGILGDSMHLKFICTFNADLQSIDKALLRKGRLKVKYEFKDLKKDKVKAIFKKLGIDESNAKDMPLCDVYNFEEENGSKIPQRNKVGFA